MFWHCEKNALCIPIADWVQGAESQDLFHPHLLSIPVLATMLGVALSMAQQSGSSSGLPLTHGGKKLEPSHCTVAVTEEGRWMALFPQQKQKIAGEASPITVGFSHVYLSLAPFLISFDGPQRQVRVHSRDFRRMAVLCKKVGSCEGLQTPAAVPLLVLPKEKDPGGTIVERVVGS